MRIRLFAAAAALLLNGAASAHADTLSFYFSFSNTTGSAPGIVTGEITGLANSGSSSATHVYVDSYPSGLGLTLSTPFDTIADSALNSFTVNNDKITGALYFAVGVGSYELGINHFSGNYLYGVNSNKETFNGDGLGGVTFTAVPETSTRTMILLFVGFGLAGCYARRALL